MTKRRIACLLILALVLGLLAGGIVSLTRAPTLWYPALTPQDGEVYAFFGERFRLRGTAELLLSGDSAVRRGDFAAFRCDRQTGGNSVMSGEEIRSLAEKLARRGAIAVVYTSDSGLSGDVYRMRGGEVEKQPIWSETGAAFAGKLYAYADRAKGAWMLAAAAAAGLGLAGYALIRRLSGKPADEAPREAPPLSRGKYVVSLVAAGLVLLGTLAWLIAPNIYQLSTGRFERGVLLASLLSLPFMAVAVLDLWNLTRAARYRRWLNILCVVLAAVLYGILLFSLVMMLLK